MRIRINFQYLFELFLVTLLSFAIYYLGYTRQLRLLINPKYNIFIFLSLIILLLFIVYLFFNLLTNMERKFNIFRKQYILVGLIIVLMFSTSYIKFQHIMTEKKGINIGETTVYKGRKEIEDRNQPEGIIEQPADSASTLELVDTDEVILNPTIITEGNRIVFNDEQFMETLNTIYGNMEEYIDRTINIKGFVYHLDDLDSSYFVISRMGMVCCAADASVVGLLCNAKNIDSVFGENDWFEIEGILKKEKLIMNSKKMDFPVVEIMVFKEIDKFDDPYVYPNFF